MTRLEANKEIIKLLSKAVKANPDWRFGQLLRNLGTIRTSQDGWTGGLTAWANEFNTESKDTLANMIKEEEKYK
jgi:hypothetical protein